MATMSATGVIVPSAFETWLIEATRVRGVNSFSYSSRMICPVLSTGATLQHGALLGGELLPGHDVGVVLEMRDDDLVALVDVAAAPRLGDEVDALRRAAHEDDAVR